MARLQLRRKLEKKPLPPQESKPSQKPEEASTSHHRGGHVQINVLANRSPELSAEYIAARVLDGRPFVADRLNVGNWRPRRGPSLDSVLRPLTDQLIGARKLKGRAGFSALTCAFSATVVLAILFTQLGLYTPLETKHYLLGCLCVFQTYGAIRNANLWTRKRKEVVRLEALIRNAYYMHPNGGDAPGVEIWLE